MFTLEMLIVLHLQTHKLFDVNIMPVYDTNFDVCTVVIIYAYTTELFENKNKTEVKIDVN